MRGPAANRRALLSAALGGGFVLVLAAATALWAQQLSKEYIHAGERLLAVKVPGAGVTPGALTATLTADRYLITAGESATLQWTTRGANSARLDPGGEAIAAAELAAGSKSVSPTTTTTYTLTATGERGSVTVMPGITATLAADPFQTTGSESVTLRWTTSGADSATLDPGGETIAAAELAAGSKTVTPSASTSYTLTARGAAGTASASATVTIGGAAPVPAPTATLVADPPTITAGGSSTLRWTTTNASSVTIDQGVGAVTPLAGGSVSVTPTTDTTYTLTATNASGSATAAATVTVGGVSSCPVIDSFSAAPTQIRSGESSTLTWETTGASTVRISGVSGTQFVDGSTSVSPTATTTYTLTARRTSCTPVTDTVTVTVTTTPPLTDPETPGATLTANPATIDAGGTARLTWSTTHAVGATIEPDLGTVTTPAAGEEARMYLTAFNTPFGVDLYHEGQTGQTPLDAGSDAVIDELGESINRIWWRRNTQQFDIGITQTGSGRASSYWGAGLTGASKSIFIYNHNHGATPGIEIRFSDFERAVANAVRFSVTDTARRQYLDSIWGGERWTMIIADAGALSLNAPAAAGGSVSVSPSETTTYTLTARGPAGITTDTAPVRVNPPPGPVIDTFTATSDTITAGGSTTLEWTTTNATAVTITGVSGTLGVDGSTSVSPTATTTYTLTASGVSGTTPATQSVTVTVTAEGPVIDTFTATTDTITAGGSTTLEWTTTNATAVTITGVSGTLGVDGSTSVSPTATTTYTLTASDGDAATDDATASVTVTVNPAGPVINKFRPNTASIRKGSGTWLVWVTTNATSASIDQGIGSVRPASGVVRVSPTETTTYTLTVGNSAGVEATATTTLTVIP